jgi:hypothetical protein
MTEQEYGLGAVQSPPDPADFDFARLVSDTETSVAAPPTSFVLPTLPPVLNQGSSPMCVAFSTSAMKSFEDRRDQGQFFDFDEPTFFKLIGGGPNGAVPRVAMDQLLKVGYPLAGSGDAAHHRIAAYYRIGLTQAELMAAIYNFGPLILSTPWYQSWFRPVGAPKTLPAPDTQVGGHAILVIGYRPTGVLLRNSWGAGWGDSGNVIMPWAYVTSRAWEAWKALDVIETTPRMRAAAGTYATYKVVNGRAIEAGRITTSGFSATYAKVGLLPATGARKMTFLRLKSGVYRGKLLRRFAKGITLL